MAAPAPLSPSSTSSEITAKPHPYQQHDHEPTKNGPVGAFEARKLKRGLYVRVDMPGVPNDGVKVVKYNETRTITFSAKAPSLWPGFDSPEPRVYAGYIVLDRDPSHIDFTSELHNGVFRLFFPRCDGSLHFLSPLRRDSGASQHDDNSGQDVEVEILAEQNISFIVHSPLEPYGIILTGGKADHINPHLLSGPKGVYEHKIVPTKDGKHVIYIRLDVPDTYNKTNVIVENSDGGIIFAGMKFKEGYNLSRFDEGTREYFGVLQPGCFCCRYNVVKHDTKDGVMRFLVRKSDNLDRSSVCHINFPPATPGGDLQPVTLNIVGDMGRTLSSRELP
ncbi:uncharacterized protein LOC141618225 [Silene latifolia]|uniref:uncharacterized protein LOC141618225 n=1 Tax=Silene latifolia TaxID=37657 RepID=UPI003D785227